MTWLTHFPALPSPVAWVVPLPTMLPWQECLPAASPPSLPTAAAPSLGIDFWGILTGKRTVTRSYLYVFGQRIEARETGGIPQHPSKPGCTLQTHPVTPPCWVSWCGLGGRAIRGRTLHSQPVPVAKQPAEPGAAKRSVSPPCSLLSSTLRPGEG